MAQLTLLNSWMAGWESNPHTRLRMPSFSVLASESLRFIFEKEQKRNWGLGSNQLRLLFRAKTAIVARPVTNSSTVAGSGTGAGV